MRVLPKSLLAAALLSIAAPAAATDSDSQLWTAVNVRGEIAPRVEVVAELAARFSDDRNGVGVGIARVGLSYRIDDALSVDVGYGRFVTYDDGDPTQKESRLFESIVWRIGPALGGQWTARTRFEQRMIEGADTTGWRVRQRIAYARPIAPHVRLTAATESFFALNRTDYGARSGYDGQRSSLIAGFALSPSVDLDVGYVHNWSHRRGREDIVANAASVALNYKF